MNGMPSNIFQVLLLSVVLVTCSHFFIIDSDGGITLTYYQFTIFFFLGQICSKLTNIYKYFEHKFIIRLHLTTLKKISSKALRIEWLTLLKLNNVLQILRHDVDKNIIDLDRKIIPTLEAYKDKLIQSPESITNAKIERVIKIILTAQEYYT